VIHDPTEPAEASSSSLDTSPEAATAQKQRKQSAASSRLRYASTAASDAFPEGEGNVDDDFLNTTYLMLLRDKTLKAELAKPTEDQIDGSMEELAEMADFYIDPYSRQFLVPDMLRQSRQSSQTTAHSVSLTPSELSKIKGSGAQPASGDFSAAEMLPFSLPLPSSRPQSDRESKGSDTGKWVAPDSWNVTNPEMVIPQTDASRSTINRSKGEVMSCIRAFRREGNFVTVPCALNITAKELCNTLARKFFIPNDAAQKYQLWVLRHGRGQFKRHYVREALIVYRDACCAARQAAPNAAALVMGTWL